MSVITAAATVRSLSTAERTQMGLKALADGEPDHGAFEVILSTPDADREGEQVKTEEWDLPLPDHITFDHDHGMSVASTVGSGTPSLDEQGRLVVHGTFASSDLAQSVRSLVTEGHIRTTSVAFMRRTKTVDGQTVTRRELLNGAFVAVPANPNAVILSAKSLTAVAEALQDSEDPVAADALSEHAVAAGKTLKATVTKALQGSFEERQEAVQRAVERLYREDYSVYAYLLGTTDSTAVWRTWSYRDDERAEWQADYSIDEAFVVTLAAPTKVRVVEIVTEVPQDGGSEQLAVASVDPEHTSAGTYPPEQPAEQVRGDLAPTDDHDDEATEVAKALALITVDQQRLDALLADAL